MLTEKQLEEVRKLVDKGFGRNTVMEKLGLSDSQAKLAIRKIRGPAPTRPKAPKTLWKSVLPRPYTKVKLTSTIKADVFRDSVDDAKRLREGLLVLGNDVATDGQLRADLSISTTSWARLRESREFAKFQFRVKGKQYWSSLQTIGEIARTCPELQTH